MNRFSRHDGLLLLMTIIWGVNFSIVKVALRQIPPLAFNTIRLAIASVLFLLAIAVVRARRNSGGGNALGGGPASGVAERPPAPILRRDWLLIAVFGFIGHFVYQICFLVGLANTTVANSSLILGCSPVVVALLVAAAGHERVRRSHWAGAALSVFGIYLVVGHGARVGAESLYGDVLTLCGLFCWSIYTVGAKGLLDRHSPLEVTGYSMAFGTVPFAVMSIGDIRSVDWQAVHADAWAALVFSAVFALFVAYLIWYSAVQRIGNVRTSIYSNLTPISALLIAVLWLGEPWTAAKVVGAAAILFGMALTRLVHPAERAMAPAEE